MRSVTVETLQQFPERLAAVADWAAAEGFAGRAVWRFTVISDGEAVDVDGRRLTGDRLPAIDPADEDETPRWAPIAVCVDEWGDDGDSHSFDHFFTNVPPWLGWDKAPPPPTSRPSFFAPVPEPKLLHAPPEVSDGD